MNTLLRLLILCVMTASLLLWGRTHYQTLQQREQQQDLIFTKENTEKGKTENREKPDSREDMDVKPDSREDMDMDMEPDYKEKSDTPVMLDKYKELYRSNNDLAGWLSIEGTVIDYPVMQCDDNEYYLHHDFYGQDSKYGCLFVKDMADLSAGTNFIIYGHNMKDGSMFGDLDLYQEESFYREHSAISFDTLYEERIYDIVAVFRSQVYREGEDVFKYYQFYEADTPEEFEYFYTNIKELSLYDTGVTAEYGDRFLTLSTCAYHVENGRFVVVAKLRE